MVARFRLIKAGPELPPGEFLSKDSTVAAYVVGIRYTLVFGMFGLFVVIRSLCGCFV